MHAPGPIPSAWRHWCLWNYYIEALTVVDSLEWRRWCPITGAFEASGVENSAPVSLVPILVSVGGRPSLRMVLRTATPFLHIFKNLG